MTGLGRLLEALPRPLDPLRSIKLKLGLLVVVSGLAGLAYFWYKIGRIPPTTSVIAIGLALLTTQIQAGQLRPLPLPLLIQLMIGPMAGHMLLRPVLQDGLGNVLPPVEAVARIFAEAFIRATAP